MVVENSTYNDIDSIFKLYDHAIAYQKAHFHRHWIAFSRPILEKEIAEKRHWKITTDDNKIGSIFSVTYSDPDIWFEKDNDVSIYIHRIAVNPLCRGVGFVPHIIAWAKAYAKNQGKKYIRIDTFSDNKKLIDYYLSCGFVYAGAARPNITEESPPHYVGIELGLYEIVVE